MTELCATDQRLCRIFVKNLNFNPGLAWEQPKPQPYRKSLGDSEEKGCRQTAVKHRIIERSNKGNLDKGNICRVLQQPDSQHATPNPSSDQKQRRAYKILTYQNMQ